MSDMSDFITIEWLSDETREIPRVGVAVKGCALTLPYNQGNSFIEQGYAKEVKPKTIKVKKGIEDVRPTS